MVGVDATQEEILVDHVKTGELAAQYQAITEAVAAWRAADEVKAQMEAEYASWLGQQADIPFAEVEPERIQRLAEIEQQWSVAKSGPYVAVETYNQGRVELLQQRFGKAGMGWCCQHRGLVPAGELKLVYHECLLWYGKSDDSYSQFPWNDGVQKYVAPMCADCRAKYGYGTRKVTIHGGVCTNVSHLFEAEEGGGQLFINFPLGWQIQGYIDGKQVIRQAVGREPMPKGVSQRKFEMRDDWYGKTADDWRIPPKLAWHINPHYPSSPSFYIKLDLPFRNAKNKRVESINLLAHL